MGGADEIVLAYANVVRHLMFDVVPNPYYGDERMSESQSRISLEAYW